MSSGNAGFFHSDSTPVRYATIRKFDGTLNPPVLVVKAIPFVGAAARAVTGALGKKKLGKVNVASKTAGTTGKTSLDQAMDFATDSNPSPAAGFGTKPLENASTSAKQSMTNLDGGGTVAVKPPSANPVGDAGGEGAAPWMRGGAGFQEAQRNAATTGGVKVNPSTTMDKVRERGMQETSSTMSDNVPIIDADDYTTATISDAGKVAEQAAEEKSTYNVPKPLQRIFGEKIDRDKAQNLGAAGLVGVQQMRGRGAQKDAARQQEAERIERIAEDGRAKANTGAKVAVA